MKAPVKVTVVREHGNSGDVLFKVVGTDKDARQYHLPAEQGAFTALHALGPRIAELLNELNGDDEAPVERKVKKR